MPQALAHRVRRRSASSALWALGAIVVGCVYPKLETSPDWKADGSAGTSDNAGAGESSSGGSPAGGAADDPINLGGETTAAGSPSLPNGGEGGAPAADIIHGVVRDQWGTPVAEVPVLIDDVELKTNKDGEFSLADSGKQTYRLSVIGTAAKTANVYEGVSARELQLSVITTGQPPHQAQIKGNLGVGPDASLAHLSVAYVDPTRLITLVGTPDATGAAPLVSYEISPSWGGKSTLSGRVVALDFKTGANGLPESYTFGSLARQLESGAQLTGVDVTLASIAKRELTVTIPVPPGVTRSDTLAFGSFVVTKLNPSESQAYFVPDHATLAAVGIDALFTSSCLPGDQSSAFLVEYLDPSVSSIEAECAEIPRVTSPANGATGVSNDAPLELAIEGAGCNTFTLTHDGSWTVNIYSTASSVKAPDLEAWGVSYAPHEVAFGATTFSPCSSIDTYVSAAPVSTPLKGRSYFSRAAPSSFATKD